MGISVDNLSRIREMVNTMVDRGGKKVKNRKLNSKNYTFEEAIKEIDSYFVNNNETNLYKFVLKKIEKPLIEDILGRVGGNKCKTARILGINRNTLYSKMRKLNIKAIR